MTDDEQSKADYATYVRVNAEIAAEAPARGARITLRRHQRQAREEAMMDRARAEIAAERGPGSPFAIAQERRDRILAERAATEQAMWDRARAEQQPQSRFVSGTGDPGPGERVTIQQALGRALVDAVRDAAQTSAPVAEAQSAPTTLTESE